MYHDGICFLTSRAPGKRSGKSSSGVQKETHENSDILRFGYASLEASRIIGEKIITIPDFSSVMLFLWAYNSETYPVLLFWFLLCRKLSDFMPTWFSMSFSRVCFCCCCFFFRLLRWQNRTLWSSRTLHLLIFLRPFLCYESEKPDAKGKRGQHFPASIRLRELNS